MMDKKFVLVALVLMGLVLFGCASSTETLTKPVEEDSGAMVEPGAPVEPSAPVEGVEPPKEMPTGDPSTQPTESEDISSITLSECLSQIRETNPEMTDQQASDNCYTVEAINKNDKSLCAEVSEEFRSLCEQQFE